MSELDKVLAHLDQNLDAAIERLFALLAHSFDLDGPGL